MEPHFLQKLEETVLKNLDNDQFGVEELASEVSQSRFQVNRKVKAITGKSVSQFIREIRVKQALNLLKETDFTTSEISYKVGFGSPSYFIKCFSEYYGITPGEVKKKLVTDAPIVNSLKSHNQNKKSTFRLLSDFWHEINDRKILNAGLAYLLTSWLVIQLFEIAFFYFHYSPLINRTILIIIICGFPVSLYFSWNFYYKDRSLQKIKLLFDQPDAEPSIIQRPFTSRSMMAVIMVSLIMTFFIPKPYDQAINGFDDFIHSNQKNKSIAVLPFKNLSGDSSIQYFADGIKETIENSLSRIGEMEVSSKTATSLYQNHTLNYSEIAGELDVQYLLTGNIMYMNDSIRITTKIIDTYRNLLMWSKQYTQPFKSQFSVMTDIAVDVANILEVRLTAKDSRSLKYYQNFIFSAQDYYMQGKEFYKFYLSNYQKDNLQYASDFYYKALKEDSTFALAYAGLGEVCKAKRGIWIYSSVHEKEYTDSIGYFADKALRLDPDLAHAWALKGEYYWYIKEIDRAIEAQQKAIILQPNLTESYINLGAIWFHEKHDPVKAFKYWLMSLHYEKNGPLLSDILNSLLGLYASIGDYNKAEEIAIRNSELHPGMIAYKLPLVFIYIEQGKFAEAKVFMDSICEYETQEGCIFFYAMIYTFTEQFDLATPLMEIHDNFAIIPASPVKKNPANHLLGYYYLKTGRFKEASEIYNVVEDFYSQEKDTWMLAEVYAEFGEYQKALQMLLKLEHENPIHSRFEFIKHLHTFKPLHENAEFKRLIDRVDDRKAKYREQIESIETGSLFQSNLLQ